SLPVLYSHQLMSTIGSISFAEKDCPFPMPESTGRSFYSILYHPLSLSRISRDHQMHQGNHPGFEMLYPGFFQIHTSAVDYLHSLRPISPPSSGYKPIKRMF